MLLFSIEFLQVNETNSRNDHAVRGIWKQMHAIACYSDNNDNISLFCTLCAHTFPFKSMSGRYWKLQTHWNTSCLLSFVVLAIWNSNACCAGEHPHGSWRLLQPPCKNVRNLPGLIMTAEWFDLWDVPRFVPSRSCLVTCWDSSYPTYPYGHSTPKFKWKGQLNDLMALFWDQCLGFWYLLVSRNSSSTRWGRINLAWICPPCRGPKHQHSEKPLVRLACQNQVTVFYLFILMLKFFKHLGE